MTVDLDKLEQLARAATPGQRDWGFVGNIPGDGCYRLDVVDEAGVHHRDQRPILITDRSDKAAGYDPLPNAADAAFIAAADPAAVQELIERVRAAEAPLIAMGADERVEAVDLIPEWYRDADSRPLGRVTMHAIGPVSAGAAVVAMDAHRAETLAAIVRDLAAKEPRVPAHDIFYPRCALCGAMVSEEAYEASDGPHEIPHAESCPWRRAVEATKPQGSTP